jgi:hypothetical protein
MAKIFRCDAGKWPAGREAIFEPMASYGDGITVNPSLLAPKEGEVHLLIEKRSHVALIYDRWTRWVAGQPYWLTIAAHPPTAQRRRQVERELWEFSGCQRR